MPQSKLSPFLALRETSPRHRVLSVVDEQGRDEASLTVGQQQRGRDLRFVQVVTSTAEPADPATLPDFRTAFASAGLDTRSTVQEATYVNIGERL